MGGRQARRAVPARRSWSPPRMTAYSAASQGRLRGLPRHHAAGRGPVHRRGVPGRRAACAASPGTPPASPRGCAREVPRRGRPGRSRSGVARTKFLAKVASGVAKPDGLLLVPPDGELAFLHPLPVERLWGVGAGHRREAARAPGHAPSARSPGSARPRWCRCSARAPGRHLHALAHNRDPRPVAGRPAAALDRRPARAGPRPAPRPTFDAVLAGLVDRVTRRLRAAGRVGPHRGAAAALRRLHPGHPLAHPAPADVAHPDGPGRGPAPARRGRARHRQPRA